MFHVLQQKFQECVQDSKRLVPKNILHLVESWKACFALLCCYALLVEDEELQERLLGTGDAFIRFGAQSCAWSQPPELSDINVT